MVWVTWRQHRGALVGTLAVTVLVSALLAWMGQGVAELNAACAAHDCWTGVAGALGDQVRFVYAALYLGQPALAGLIAVFWGAPLLAREFEQRTNLLAWSQDVTPLRWLGGKIALLGAAAVVLSAVVAIVSWQLIGEMKASGETAFGMSDYRALELWPPTQVLYTLFGFALGLVVGLLTRRTVLAMGVTLVVFAGVRFLVAYTVLWWQPPVRLLVPASAASPFPPGAYELGISYLDSSGQLVTRIPCPDTECLVAHGVPTQELVFQPIDRLGSFQWMEVIAYALLTVVLAGVAWTVVRRATRVS